jgi:hypothetical protein
MLSSQLRAQLNEAVLQLCVDLGIPYSPRESKPSEDRRPYLLAAALTWIAEEAIKDAQVTIDDQTKELARLKRQQLPKR